MTVSRSAIAKWETDKGIPDVENLKALARLLNVSVDYLLNDGGAVDVQVIRQVYNLSDYGKGGKKQKKDRLILERFPDAQIHTLLGELKLTKGEKVVDNALGFLTDAPFGIPGLINGIKNLDQEFYLVEKDGKQLFVTVTDEFIETRQLSKPVTGDKFEIGNWKFIKCAYNVQASSGLYEKVKKVGMLLLLLILIGAIFLPWTEMWHEFGQNLYRLLHD